MKKYFSIPLMLVFISVTGCVATNGANIRNSCIDDMDLSRKFEKSMGELLKNKKYTSKKELLSQLKRKTCFLGLPKPGKKAMSAVDIYEKCRKSVVLVGSFYKCSNPKHPYHSNNASGYIIKDTGVVVTNYHVVNSGINYFMLGVMTIDGDVYPVKEVLAASRKDDIAILQLEGAKGLPAAPLYEMEQVGSPVTLITHPAGRYYVLTRGYISRYYKGRNKTNIMSITADYAKGSSGGPVFNRYGAVVGMVASTSSVSYRKVNLEESGSGKALKVTKKHVCDPVKDLYLNMDHQMTFKDCVPGTEVLKLIKKPGSSE
jgi:serine protease Do